MWIWPWSWSISATSSGEMSDSPQKSPKDSTVPDVDTYGEASSSPETMTETREQFVEKALAEFESPLIGYAVTLLNDLDRARDVVQDTFIRLCQQEPNKIRESLKTWLFTVCRRHVVDILRKENRMTALSETVEPPITHNGPAELVEANDLNRAVLDRLNGFPPSQQEAVRLKFLQQFSYREIAEVMNVSESHVGVLIHTAIKKLRQAFAERAVCS